MFVLDIRLFEQPMVRRSVGHTEFGLPQTIVAASRTLGIPFQAVEATWWRQVTEPRDLEELKEEIERKE